jgi:2-polyprenyl-3-methyl-5-hydroxy-6-metoxy-1,4-benzoquinol methylase
LSKVVACVADLSRGSSIWNNNMLTQTSNPWENEYKENQQSLVYEPLWKKLQFFLKSVHGKSILDYGCGDGNYSILIENMGFKVIGIDISSNAIQIAKKSINSENIFFYTAHSIPESIHQNSFDVVVMLNVLHCLSNGDRPKLLEKTRRVLKDKGYLFASVLTTEDESYPRSEWREIESGTFDDGSGKLFHFFTLDEIIDELKGLNIIQTEILENVHPAVGRKSSLHIIVGQNEK